MHVDSPNMSIQKKSALLLRKEPSSSALQYFTRKNMWNTKSRPAAENRLDHSPFPKPGTDKVRVPE